jgi:hypothetical protein
MVWLWLWLFSQTRLGPRPIRVWVASARGGESPILVGGAEGGDARASAAKVCTSAARKTAGNPLRARGAKLLSMVGFPCFALSAGRCFGLVVEGIAARRACRGGAGRRQFIASCRLGGDFIPLVREFNKRICYSAMKRQTCSYDTICEAFAIATRCLSLSGPMGSVTKRKCFYRLPGKRRYCQRKCRHIPMHARSDRTWQLTGHQLKDPLCSGS